MQQTGNRGLITLMGIVIAIVVLGIALYFFLAKNEEGHITYAALGEEFELDEGGVAEIEGEGLQIEVVGFVNSPCPTETECVWSGQGVILSYTHEGKTEEGLNLSSAFGYHTQVTYSDYETTARLKVTKEEAASPATYRSPTGELTARIPIEPEFVVEATTAAVPFGTSTPIAGERLVYYAPVVPDCPAGEGACGDRLDNVAVGFFTINRPVGEVLQELQTAFGPEVKTRTIGSGEKRTASYVTLGAEGTGMVYYFVRLEVVGVEGGYTLMITERYHDEAVIGKYNGAAGYVPREQQKKLSDEIINSIRFEVQAFG